MNKFITLILVNVLLWGVSGCAQIIGGNVAAVQLSPSYAEIKEQPKRFLGKNAILGGSIVQLKNSADGGQLEIIEYKLNEDGFPDEAEGSAGRFLAISPTYLDESVYRKGELVTISGEVKGAKTAAFGESTYTYPLLSIREIRLWHHETKPATPYQIPGTNLVDPYYSGYDLPSNSPYPIPAQQPQ